MEDVQRFGRGLARPARIEDFAPFPLMPADGQGVEGENQGNPAEVPVVEAREKPKQQQQYDGAAQHQLRQKRQGVDAETFLQLYK